MGRILLALTALAALGATGGDYAAAQRKLELIAQGRVPAGGLVVFPEEELNAFVRRAAADVAPEGVHNPRLELGRNRATGYATIDFSRLQQSGGGPVHWLLERLLGGERPVRIDARIRSGGGQAVVDVDRVEISGRRISGAALDFLVRNFLRAYYPDAKVGQPFELARGVDRLEVDPREVRVVMGR